MESTKRTFVIFPPSRRKVSERSGVNFSSVTGATTGELSPLVTTTAGRGAAFPAMVRLGDTGALTLDEPLILLGRGLRGEVKSGVVSLIATGVGSATTVRLIGSVIRRGRGRLGEVGACEVGVEALVGTGAILLDGSDLLTVLIILAGSGRLGEVGATLLLVVSKTIVRGGELGPSPSRRGTGRLGEVGAVVRLGSGRRGEVDMVFCRG